MLPSTTRRNFRLGVLNGALFTLGESLVDTTAVLALLVRDLGGSQTLVGLLPSLKNGGFLLPQLLVAGRVDSLARKLPLYRRAALARAGAFAALTMVIFGATLLPPTLTLTLVCIVYAIYNLLGGSSSLAFQDIVAKVIPPQRRGSFFAYRQLWGGLLAFVVAGPLVRLLLQADAPLGFPANYGLLSLLALICIALGLLAFSLIDEPPGRHATQRRSTRDLLRSAPYLLRRDLDLRRFVVARVWGRVGAIADPFYVVYAREALAIAPRYVGLYLAVRVLSAALSNLYWGRLADRRGARRLMVWTGAIAALAPLVALLLPVLFAPGSTALAWSWTLVFLAIGLSVDGSATAGTTYLLEIAPEQERATYGGIANTALGLATFVPVLGGALLAATANNYVLLLLIGLIGSLLAWVATVRLREVREVREDMRLAAELWRRPPAAHTGDEADA